MKKNGLFIIVLLFFGACQKELVKKPNNLIDKKIMMDILYDMTLLDVLKYQNPSSLFKNHINPKIYIYKKYKIDSVQFAKSNAYYAADYREYKNMFDELNKRLKNNKHKVDSVIKIQRKKVAALKKAKTKKAQDSIKKIKKEKIKIQN